MKRIYADRPVIDHAYVSEYMHKLKDRFLNAPHVFPSFINIVSSYLHGEKSFDVVIREVGLLFEGNGDDLIDELNNWFSS
ncbi:hypothetical protein MtrunA17_Chr7g0218881 [Medicago truncatula]|uniref:Paired amphipathic helix protein n=2 Tax=Medicago truncatula TaxID=3880 RepID=A0A396GY49_MEDTR|nr:hypothetical protein MtrunA17_Chr7g0218881 [Medicago truncatula]